MLRIVASDTASSLRSLRGSGTPGSLGRRTIQPKSIKSATLPDPSRPHMVFASARRHGEDLPGGGYGSLRPGGQAGGRIVLARPAVEAGETPSLSAGHAAEKVTLTCGRFYDALYDLLEAEKVDKLLEKNVIEIAPIAFMAGTHAQSIVHHSR